MLVAFSSNFICLDFQSLKWRNTKKYVEDEKNIMIMKMNEKKKTEINTKNAMSSQL